MDGILSYSPGKLASKLPFAGKKSGRAEIWHDALLPPSDELHEFPLPHP